MIPLSGFAKKYVAVMFDARTESALRAWALSYGFDLTAKFDGTTQAIEDFDFHTTVFYTNNIVYSETGIVPLKRPFKIRPIGFDLLGLDNNIPVMLIAPEDELLEIRHIFEEAGMEDQWPAYKPHITVSYGYKGQPPIENLQLPDFDIIVDRVKISDQKS